MRQRTTKDVSASAHKIPKVKRNHDETEARWKKSSLFALIVILVLVPFILIVARELFQHLVYKYRIKVPLFVDLNTPIDFSLNHTINMYLTSEEGISLGVWHTVPESKWREAQGKDIEWYQSTLNDGSPVFIYLHGNTGTRAATHRVGVAKLLSALGYHVLVPDYRGFGDSSGEPTEAGLTTDALHVYNWVKERSGSSLVVFWGHSLGTGVSTNTAVKLVEQEPWAENKVVLPTGQNLRRMKSPLLFLHAEDDPALIQSAQELYEVAVSTQNVDRVKFVSFEGYLGYVHNGLYRDPRLPGIIKNFVLSL
ncbi:lysophosphatidylserine lipase ABHD12-like isoform X6 [Syngnathoides biaculeatus]|uniref:lysophosphatidylserine lipase ABHD12-like isoform X6 n=1 Tax=Syngnathoides biaculeatus TaxID=300417 RepID=UPI002ADDB548|nr:lysophosphatidylserine lipase ABHD12-like isoform X6 [Syngnathoides biaculeatus]